MSQHPKAMGARCDECPRNGRTPLRGEGPSGARLCIIGDQPSRSDVRADRVFSGGPGKLLWQLLGRAWQAINKPLPDRAQWRLTNAALCDAPWDEKPAQTRAAYACCRPRLVNELRALAPDAKVLVLGGLAATSLTGEKKTSRLFGFHSWLGTLDDESDVRK